MIEGFSLSLDFLNQSVPLWFALLMAFTAPYMWAKYAKRAVRHVIESKLDEDE